MWQAPERGDRCSRGTQAPPTLRRHGIVTLPAPGMTTAYAPQAQRSPPKKTVGLERFQKVVRTAGLKPAAGTWSAEKGEHRRNGQLITTDEKTHEEKHQGAKIEARSARRNHSSFSTE